MFRFDPAKNDLPRTMGALLVDYARLKFAFPRDLFLEAILMDKPLTRLEKRRKRIWRQFYKRMLKEFFRVPFWNLPENWSHNLIAEFSSANGYKNHLGNFSNQSLQNGLIVDAMQTWQKSLRAAETRKHPDAPGAQQEAQRQRRKRCKLAQTRQAIEQELSRRDKERIVFVTTAPQPFGLESPLHPVLIFQNSR